MIYSDAEGHIHYKRSRMKRLRKFYDDHEQACNIAIGMTAFFVSYYAGVRVMRKIGPKNHPIGVNLWSLDGGTAQMIEVQMSNGYSHQFTRDVANGIKDAVAAA